VAAPEGSDGDMLLLLLIEVREWSVHNGSVTQFIYKQITFCFICM
jgi:hypothetical protein